MKLSTPIIVLIVLVVGIIIVMIIQARQKTLEMQARQQQAQAEAAIAMQYLSYANNQQQINSQGSAGVADWLNTISSIGGAVSSIFGSGIIGGNDNGGTGEQSSLNTSGNFMPPD